jgi:hypothetical protein
MKITKTQLRKIIREELLKEDDYATQYVVKLRIKS